MNAVLPTAIASAPASETVTIEGALTVAAAEAWRVRFAETLARGAGLTVDVSTANEIDVFGVQLLWAAHRSAGERGSAFAVVDPHGLLQRACAAAGFSPATF